MKTQTAQTQKTATLTPEFKSSKRGDRYYDATPEILNLINSQYPGLLTAIYDAGLINGSRFHKIYFSHYVTTKNKTIQITHFPKNIVTPKQYQNLPPATPAGLHVTTSTELKKQYPNIYKIISSFNFPKHTIITVTPIIKTTDKKTLHYNSGY